MGAKRIAHVVGITSSAHMDWRGTLLFCALPLLVCSAPLTTDEVATELKLACSDPPLAVTYGDLGFYSGKVDCGNLLLESEIGGTHPWIAPKVQWCATDQSCIFPSADSSLYTLVYLDPFVDVPNKGSYPTCKPNCAGSKAPARHWVVGNLDSRMLRSGNFSGATTVSAFKGPSPPWGSHPYGQFLFRQHGEKKIDFETLPSPTDIYNWDYNAFLDKYEIAKEPVSQNYHVTQHADPRG